jgi:hypothetical protein
MRIREADQEVGRARAGFVAPWRSRILKSQKFLKLGKIWFRKEGPHPADAGCGS